MELDKSVSVLSCQLRDMRRVKNLKIDAEMKGILSMTYARDCSEHYSHYHLLVGFGYAHCRLQKDQLEPDQKECDSTVCFLLNTCVCISVYFNLLIKIICSHVLLQVREGQMLLIPLWICI